MCHAIVLQGACPGTKKRVITLRKTLFPQTSRSALEEVKLKASFGLLHCVMMMRAVVLPLC